MQSAVLKIDHLLGKLEKEDYEKAISYIEFLIDARKKEKTGEKKLSIDKTNVETIINSLTGAIPDTGKTLEEYKNERLKKYEFSD